MFQNILYKIELPKTLCKKNVSSSKLMMEILSERSEIDFSHGSDHSSHSFWTRDFFGAI